MLLLLHTGLVQECFFVGRGWGWALIKFLAFQGGSLFKGGQIIEYLRLLNPSSYNENSTLEVRYMKFIYFKL